jgi:Tol biopolymer transport system component
MTGPVGARNPVWSPDGRRILYVSTQGAARRDLVAAG